MTPSKAKLMPIVALAALTASGASAGPNLNSSKSNIYRLDMSNPDAGRQCIEKGGQVKDGMCVTPEDPPQSADTAKKICLIYQPGHQGDDRYCSQSVPAPK
jgi:hypothetical protein